jgi:adenylate cyclase
VLAGELERHNVFIRQTFGRYLSEEVVDSLLDTPEGLQLGGEKRYVTVLMSDLRAFSSLSESLRPEQVVTMLNNYLGVMAEIIGEYNGTIDEFIGDAILALFGAPVQRKDDAERAVACAMAMQLAMDSVNAKNRDLGFPEIEMGIAVNTGEVVVGNIGSQKRSKYGVVGSQVNLTGRIESYTVGGQILVAQSTVDAVGSILKLGEKLSLGAKGFKDPVVVHDLRGIGGPYNLFLEQRQEELKTLVREIPLRVCELEGKHVCGEEFEGSMVRLSLQEGEMRSGEMRSNSPLTPMKNIRIRFTGLNGVLIPGDLYAKVMGEGPDGYKLHFTSIPTEVKTFLRSALANETTGLDKSQS